MIERIQDLTIEAGGVLLALSLVISGMVWFCVWIYPRKTRGDQFLRNTVEDRYRVEQGHE